MSRSGGLMETIVRDRPGLSRREVTDVSGDILQPGTVLDQTYQIVRTLGEGGAGVVYEARHLKLGHGVAIKVLFGHLARSRSIRGRFIEEAQIQAQIRHLNLVTVTDILDGEQGTVAIVLELIKGPSLDGYIRENHPVDQEQAVAIMRGVAAGLGFAHDQGVIHRDIKPDNVLIAQLSSGPVPKVSDFGIAKILAADGRTREGARMGTVAYMAPEQIEDASRVDARADIYSLGVTMFELLTGEIPFSGENIFAVMKAHQDTRVPSPVSLRPDLAPAIDAIIRRAMAKQPEDRYQSCAELDEALARVDLNAPRPVRDLVPVTASRRAVGSASRPRVSGRQRTVPPRLSQQPTRPLTRVPLTDELPRVRRRRHSTTVQATAAPGVVQHESRYKGETLTRTKRVLIIATSLLFLYQVLPFGECLYEANDAFNLGSANEAAFNPGGYDRLDEESARQIAQAGEFGAAFSEGASVCSVQAGFGHGRHPIVNMLFGLSLLGLLSIVLIERVNRTTLRRPETSSLPLARPARAPVKRPEVIPISFEPEDVGVKEGTLVSIEGQPSVPIGSDLYLALKTRGLGQTDIKDLKVQVLAESSDGRNVPLYANGGEALTPLLSRVPTSDSFSALPFVVGYERIRETLSDRGLDGEKALAAQVRVSYQGQGLSHRTAFEHD